jgi:hypothetical protein
MDREIGQAQMVRWQGRRADAQTRARTRTARLVVALALLSAVSLMIGFYSGLPIPLSLLQTTFVVLVALSGLLGAWTLTQAVMRRHQGTGVLRRR